MTGRERFKKNKEIIEVLIKVIKLFPRFIRVLMWDWSSRYSQVFFIGIRYILLKSLIKDCGANVRIGTNVQIINWHGLSLGDNISIHANCYIDAVGEIEINNNVSIAHSTSILSSNHTWEDDMLPIKYNPLSVGKVIIEDDVWIGCGCRILSGLRIEHRSIIAAGAVVNKGVFSKGIYGGVPAKLIKTI